MNPDPGGPKTWGSISESGSQTLKKNHNITVSPAYGYVSLALVKCSNEGGPGPRYNMKEVPGSSSLTMMVVHGYHLYLMPLFS
jgi:hypothetical protein